MWKVIRLKVFALAWAGSWWLACQNGPVRPTFSYPANLGLAVEKAGHNCLYIPNSRLVPGQRVQFVTSAAPQTAGEVEIVGKAGDTCKDPGQNQAGMSSYSFKVIRGSLQMGAPAFAIANSNRPVRATEEGLAADLEGDGQLEYFRACTSTEGLHLTIWKGKPLAGARKWHNYYYLGYDVTPDCTEKETSAER
jgi:hypothetical protein